MISSMLLTFIRSLKESCRIGEGDAVLACCSGGIDSMVLLDLLLQAAPDLRLKVGVVHVDHGIRGEESKRDARFVSDRCEKLGIACHVYSLGMSRQTPNLEESARIGRYEKIFACMREHGYTAAATGHTLDDQAETIIYRLVRGSGIRGLAGMDSRDAQGLIRPLLGFSKEQVKEYAESRKIPHVEDGTNLDTALARNLIRLEIIPAMRRINPSVPWAVARLGDIAREEEACMERLVDELEGVSLVHGWGILRVHRLDVLASSPLAVLKRLIIRTVSSLLGEPRGIDAAQVAQIMDVVLGTKSGHTVKRKVSVSRERDCLVFRPSGTGPFYSFEVSEPGTHVIGALGQRVRIDWTRPPSSPLVLTTPTAGGRIGGSRVVKLLADRGVLRSMRPFWPVLLSGEEVVSIAGVRDSMDLITQFPCQVSS